MTALAYHTSPNPTLDRHKYRFVRLSSPTAMAAGHYRPFQRDYVTEFNELLQQWKIETALLSSTHEMMHTTSFAGIVNLGEKAIPLILAELRKQPSFLFLALHSITKENPVPASIQGQVKEIVNSWLTWASRSRGYVD